MKRLRLTLNGYLARHYAMHIGGFLFVLLAVIALFDAIELMRRLAKVGSVDAGLIGYLALLKMPGNILMIAPFIILFAAMFTLSVLTRRQELSVMRTAGASLWQLMVPFFAVAFIYGILLVGVVNPLSAVTERLYLRYEEKFLKKEAHMVALLGQGLWLRQTIIPDDRAEMVRSGSMPIGGYFLVHARQVTLPQWDLEQVMVLSFDDHHRFQERLDAVSAQLVKGFWVFGPAVRTRVGQPPEKVDHYEFATTLTRADLEESFSTPETVSFWQMPGFIAVLKASGFPVMKLQIHFGTLLMMPFLLVALVMIAVAVSVRTGRVTGQFRLVVAGVLIGFMIFFMNNFLQALGASGQIPVWLASVGPGFLIASLGIMVIFSMEDQ